MTKIVNIDNAVVDTDKFRGYNEEAQRILNEQELLKEDYKILIDTVANETKIKKGDVSKYFKARAKFKSKEEVKKGELFEALDSALDD